MSYADDAGAAQRAAPNRPDAPMSLLHKLRAMPGGNILIAFLAIEFLCVLGARRSRTSSATSPAPTSR